LIHVEQQWKENALTAQGRIMHKRTDQPFLVETRPGKIVSRALPVVSYSLGFTGICDVVEFIHSSDGIRLPGREGLYLPIPVEYKRGKEKKDQSDSAQLCAQAICLEEMLAVQISKGYLFYGQTKHRLEIEFNEELRNLVWNTAQEMHAYFERGYTPHVKKSKACESCSLADLCLPNLSEKTIAASTYIQKQIENA
jgi:CRISPR-associated exonuclease Cas4